MRKVFLAIVWLAGALGLFFLIEDNTQARGAMGAFLPILAIIVTALFWIGRRERLPQGARQAISGLAFFMTVPYGTVVIALVKVLGFSHGFERAFRISFGLLPRSFFAGIGIIVLAVILGSFLERRILKGHEKKQGKRFQDLPGDLKE